MAFLCPSRLGKAKHKKGYHQTPLGRISGSGSTDTLLNIHLAKKGGLGPDQRMIILHNFSSYTAEELNVKQGQKVYILYREYDWAFVLTDDKKEGFVPFTYLARVGIAPAAVQSPEVKQRLDNRNSNSSTNRRSSRSKKTQSVVIGDSWENDSSGLGHWSGESLPSSPRSDCSSDSGPEITTTIEEQDESFIPEHNTFNTDSYKAGGHPPDNGYSTSGDINGPSPCQNRLTECLDISMKYVPFRKVNQGDYLVLFDFDGQDESEVTVSAAEKVRLLNSEDDGWYWVRTSNGLEGFVPRSFLFPISLLQPKDGYRSQRSSMYVESTSYTDPSFSHLFSSSANKGSTPRKLDITGSNPANQNVRVRKSAAQKDIRPISFHQGMNPLGNTTKDSTSLAQNMHADSIVSSTGGVKPTWAMLASFAGGKKSSATKSSANDTNAIKQNINLNNNSEKETNQNKYINDSISEDAEEADDEQLNQQTTSSHSHGPPEIHVRLEKDVKVDCREETTEPRDTSTMKTVKVKPGNRCNDSPEEHKEIKDAGNDTETNSGGGDAKNVTEFVAIFDYTAQGSVDVSFNRGEFLQVDPSDQDNEEWYWAYSSRYNRTGYIPRSYVKVAQVTVI